MSKSLRIRHLCVENFKRITLASVNFPESGTMEVYGRNENGKSSFIDALFSLLAGSSATPPTPIHRGAIKAKNRVDLGEYIVEREFTGKGSELTVYDSQGVKIKKTPQTVLSGLFSKFAFDPQEFSRMKPPEQAEMLRRVVGIDFTALDAKRATVYSERTEVNRARDAQAAILLELSEVEPIEPVSAADLNQQLQAATARNREVADARRILERKEDEADAIYQRTVTDEESLPKVRERLETALGETLELNRTIGEEVDTAEIIRKIAELNAQLATANEHNKQVTVRRSAAQRKQFEATQAENDLSAIETRMAADRQRLDVANAEINRLNDTLPIETDTTPILAAIANAEATNRQARAYAERQAALERLRGIREQSEDLTQVIADIDAKRLKILRAAKFPAPGLSLEGNMVTLDGIPFEQASTSQKIKVGLMIGAALNPTLKLIVIKDGGALDANNMQLIDRWSTDNDYLVLIERVADTAIGVGVRFVEGEVAKPVVQEVAR